MRAALSVHDYKLILREEGAGAYYKTHQAEQLPRQVKFTKGVITQDSNVGTETVIMQFCHNESNEKRPDTTNCLFVGWE